MEKKTRKKWSRRKKILVTVAIVLLVTIASSAVVSYLIYGQSFPRYDAHEISPYLKYSDVEQQLPRRVVSFDSGGNKLVGYVYGADNDKGLVVISHGLGGGADSYLAEALWFVQNGWRVFAYDNTGSHASEGKDTRGLVQSALDLDAALSFVQSDEQLSGLPVCLYGHSWGGYAVTAGLGFGHDVAASVSVAGYNSAIEMLKDTVYDMMGRPLGTVLAQPYLWTINKLRFGSMAGLAAVDGINAADTSVMIVHGTEDEMIKFDGAAIIAHKEQISNPDVVYVVRDTPGRDGHNTLFISAAAAEYIEHQNEIYREIYEQYDGEVPQEVRREFYDGLDVLLTNELDAEYMEMVNEFFEQAVLERQA